MQQQDKLKFTELAILAMQKANRPMTPSQLWQFVLDNNLHHRLNSFDKTTQTFKGKTPQATFHACICTDKVSFKEIANSKPKQYQLKDTTVKNLHVEGTGKTTPSVRSNVSFYERELHPLLAYFLKEDEYFKAYSKTIFHEESFKGTKGEDKWLYPDMVAVNFEYANYQQNNVLNFIKKFDILPVKIFSFEIKKELNFSNYKESFFQAVSNSSWANEGYLVALTIKKDSQFVEALQKLSMSFGIGIIELDVVSLHQSKILSPAKFKEKMDYSVIDELARKNPNFKQFLKTVTDFDVSNPNRFLSEFDKVLSSDNLNSFLNSKLNIN